MSPRISGHAPVRPVLATVALASLLITLPAAKSGCGSKEGNTTLTSPVQSVAFVLEKDGGEVQAEVVVISTKTDPHSYVDNAQSVSVRVPGGDSVELSRNAPGHYTLSSLDNDALTYRGGETYQFSFELDDEEAAGDLAGGNFSGVVDAPDDDVSFSLSRAPEFAGDTARLEYSPSSRYALIRVHHVESDTLTYSNFDFESSAQFDGSKWARLTKGGSEELSVDVFPDPGTYTISFCAVEAVRDFDTSLSAELGALSGFVIGRCAADQQIVLE